MSDEPGDLPLSGPSGSPQDVRAYLSDMLAELADLARSVGDARLEYGLRLLALDAAGSPR